MFSKWVCGDGKWRPNNIRPNGLLEILLIIIVTIIIVIITTIIIVIIIPTPWLNQGSHFSQTQQPVRLMKDSQDADTFTTIALLAVSPVQTLRCH